MPKTLIVAATPFEITGLSKHFEIPVDGSDGFFPGKNNVSLLITGVGMVNTAYYMGRYSGHDFDHIINAGICGAFKQTLVIGEIVQVVSDTLAELGAEDDGNFIPFKELNLGGTATYHGKNNLNISFLDKTKQVSGITVNKVHGNDESIQKTIALYNPDVESMEGAAFFRACEHMKSNCLQVRAVSNFVEKRDKSKWNIPLAIGNLNDFIIQLINSLNK